MSDSKNDNTSDPIADYAREEMKQRKVGKGMKEDEDDTGYEPHDRNATDRE